MIRGRLLGAAAVAALSNMPVLAQESAQIAAGRALYAEHCALCHGPDGKRGAGFQTPIWGQGTMIGSKFAHAQGLFEYMQMLMPFQDPAILTDDQKMAVVAYMLANHGAIPPSGEVAASNMASIPIR
jgi:mono/diheme cytochrome c family protein